MVIKKVTVLVRTGCVDRVLLKIEGTSPFPEMEALNPGKYPPYLETHTREGYGVIWVAENFGIYLDDPRLEVLT